MTMTQQQGHIEHKERVQTVALGVHAIVDRFSSHEHAFGQRLKETALELIEDVSLYEIARTRDAAGTAQLIHKLIGNADGLKSLLSFVKHRGLAKPATVDVLDWELTQLLDAFKREDARFEEHVSRINPHGESVSSAPAAPSHETAGLISTKPPRRHIPTPESADELGSFDPLLGPDEGAAVSSDLPSEALAKGGTSPAPRSLGEVGPAPRSLGEVGPAPRLAPRSLKGEVGSLGEVGPMGSERGESPVTQARKEAVVAVAEPPSALPTVQQGQSVASAAANEAESLPSLASTSDASRGGRAKELTNRQHKIMNFFRHKKDAPLKLVMQEALPGVSEKTTRNDLLTLVKFGLLRRVGKAPRSKYVLTA